MLLFLAGIVTGVALTIGLIAIYFVGFELW
jgi:hypothetical protein